MPRDTQMLRLLREATRNAARDMRNLKLIKPDQNPQIQRLQSELDGLLMKHCTRVAEAARSASSQAKASSRQHRLDLREMKDFAKEAAENIIEFRRRHSHSESKAA